MIGSVDTASQAHQPLKISCARSVDIAKIVDKE